jgi:hypothetical protein
MVKKLVEATERFTLILLLTFFTEKGKQNLNASEGNADGK